MSAASDVENSRWTSIAGGVSALLFGIAAVFWPQITLLVILYLFSSYVLIAGIINVIEGISEISIADSWFLTIILGLFEVGVGIYLLRHPHVVFTTFVLLIGFVLIASGIVDMIAAYISEGITTKTRAIGYLVGIISVVAGIIVLFAKNKNGVAFVWLLGVYGIVVGTLKIATIPRSIDR